MSLDVMVFNLPTRNVVGLLLDKCTNRTIMEFVSLFCQKDLCFNYLDADSNNYAVDSIDAAAGIDKQALEKQTKDLFITFHCFCTRKDVS